MSEEKAPEVSPDAPVGYCSATATSKEGLQKEIRKELKTSDVYTTCNLPKRFEHPHWFNGYGCQVSKQHPFYRTTASTYGWYPPGPFTITSAHYPKTQKFSSMLAEAGMYRNYSLNTGLAKP